MIDNFFNVRSCGQLTTFLGECMLQTHATSNQTEHEETRGNKYESVEVQFSHEIYM